MEEGVNDPLRFVTKGAIFEEKNTLYKYTGEYFRNNLMTKLIPRFIYHLTTKTNYNAIKTSGFLRTSIDESLKGCSEGIFCVELENLFHRWTKFKLGKQSLSTCLLGQAVTGDLNCELVLLKIPTKNLKINKLKIRSQNDLFGANNEYMNWICRFSNYYEILKNEGKDSLINLLSKMKKTDQDFVYDIMGKYLKPTSSKIPSKTELLDQVPINLPFVASAKNRKLFKQRKQAIEYIYEENLPLSAFEKIGEVDLKRFNVTTSSDINATSLSIFSSLLKNTPESKNIQI